MPNNINILMRKEIDVLLKYRSFTLPRAAGIDVCTRRQRETGGYIKTAKYKVKTLYN